MGELINLASWQLRKQREEDRLLTEDLEALKAELELLISGMESESGPMSYTKGMMDLLPQFVMLDQQLDGYYDAWLELLTTADEIDD